MTGQQLGGHSTAAHRRRRISKAGIAMAAIQLLLGPASAWAQDAPAAVSSFAIADQSDGPAIPMLGGEWFAGDAFDQFIGAVAFALRMDVLAKPV